MFAFRQSSNTYSLSILNSEIQNIYNEIHDFETTTQPSTIDTKIENTTFDQFTNGLINNLTDVQISEISDNNKTVISNELDLKYSLMFIIDFQVILFNALIIAHLLKAKSFQKSSSARYFVLSLAVSDILVGILVMPLGIVSLMVNKWLFGKLFCELWQVMDFFVCTASIFNLCTISIDRYIAISKPLIYMKMSNTRVCVIIVLVWLASALITFPPMIAERIGLIQDVCKAKLDCSSCESLFDLVPVYVIFATISSFFLPVLLVIITNYRTYLIVKRHMFARNNNGRISLSNKQKPKKLKFFVHLFGKEKDKNQPIELNSFENHQKNQALPRKLSPNDQQYSNNSCGCCGKDSLADKSYLQTSTSLKNQSLFWTHFNKCFNWMLNRDCSTIDSKIVESKIITTHFNPHYSSCTHHQCHLDHDLASLNTVSENESNKCTTKLTKCLIRCCTLNGLICKNSSNTNRQSTKFSSLRALFFPNNSSNAQILDIDMTNLNDNNNNLNNIRNCTHCALNSLNAFYRTNQLNHQTRNEQQQLFLNEELLVDEEESTSGSKNRQESASVSILVNSHDSNDEIMNENSSNFNETNLVDVSNALNNSINSVTSNNHLLNGCLINSRCIKEINSNSKCNKGINCCGYCCTLCLECSNCRVDFNRMLDMFKKTNNYQIKNSKDNKLNSANKIVNCTNSINKQSSNQNDKLCKPEHHHHLNCAHFKNNQLLTNSNKTAMTLIRCDHCGHTLLQDQSKTLCLHRLTTHPHQSTKNSKKVHLCLSNNHHLNHQQQHLKYSHKSNHLHHHCIHAHCPQNFNIPLPRQSNNSIYTEMSSESNRPESTNSAELKDKNENPPSTSSDYKRTNKTSNSSFDDELRINCGTGQLQKSIGFFATANKSQTGNSSTNSDNKSAKLKLKKLAYYAGNVGNLALGNSRNNKLNTIRREYKATKTLATITFVFIIMWSPYYLIFLLQTVCADCFLFKNFASHFWHQTLWLGWSNSYINCLIYIYFSRKLRNSIINTLMCRKN